jgi:hypothetical protein
LLRRDQAGGEGDDEGAGAQGEYQAPQGRPGRAALR